MTYKEISEMATGKAPEGARWWKAGWMDVEGFTYMDGEHLYVCIPGSEHIKTGLMDWILNLLYIPWWDRDSRRFVPLGMLIRARRIEKIAVKMIYNINVHVTICGHSMGAGIAQLFPWADRYVLFSPPRVFLWSVPALIKSKIKAFRFGKDPVPFLPPLWKGPNLTQIGEPNKGILGRFKDHMPGTYRKHFEKT